MGPKLTFHLVRVKGLKCWLQGVQFMMRGYVRDEFVRLYSCSCLLMLCIEHFGDIKKYVMCILYINIYIFTEICSVYTCSKYTVYVL